MACGLIAVRYWSVTTGVGLDSRQVMKCDDWRGVR